VEYEIRCVGRLVAHDRACFPRGMLGKMSTRNKPSPIAIAVGVLVLGAPLVVVALNFPATTTNVLLDVALWIAGGVLWLGLYESRGYRNLMIGVFGLPIGIALVYEAAGDVVAALAMAAFAGWLVFGLVMKARPQRQVARYLAGVVGTLLAIVAVVTLMERDNKFHAALAFMLAAGAYLAWRNWVGPQAPDPWCWSRDKSGNWRA
jgi:hypothetical protein